MKQRIIVLLTNLGTSFKKTHRTKKITVINLTITGLLLSLTLLSNFLSKFMIFNPILKFDFSLVFVFVAFFFLGWFNGIIIILTRFILGPLLEDINIIPASYLGHFILLITHMIYITVFTLAYKFFKNFLLQKTQTEHIENIDGAITSNKIDLRQFLVRHSVVFGLSILMTTIIITLLNVFFLTPLYFWIYYKLGAPLYPIQGPLLNSFLTAFNRSASFRIYFLGIPNYYAGAFSIFISFNLINLTLNSIIIGVIIFTDYSTGLFSKLKGETASRY